jgi:flavin reductase (DIM6/NTAB) family NADH-FMN oxidoreductase RutF
MGFSTLTIDDMDLATRYRLVTSCVQPRPIAWVTTLNGQGLVNVAPFSSYNYVAHSPPMVAINMGSRAGKLKDTARNIMASREFVINVPTEETLEVMHKSSAEYPADVSEAEQLGITLLPSTLVKPPRIAASPIQMECRLTHVLPLGSGLNTLYHADIVVFHQSNDIFDGRHVDVSRIHPVMRLAGPQYATIGKIIPLEPAFTTPGSVRKETAP